MNHRPKAYESSALPLSYPGPMMVAIMVESPTASQAKCKINLEGQGDEIRDEGFLPKL